MRFVFMLVCAALCAGLLLQTQIIIPPTIAAPELLQQQTGNADSALKQGKQLLKRGHADQALGYLENALQLYTAAKNKRGIASAQNELGDLYLRQGQTKTALDHYRKAYESLSGLATQEKQEASSAGSAARRASADAGTLTEAAASVSDSDFNANLLLAKIGDANARLGLMPDASAAYN